jgi:hypothetical protein
MRAKKRLYMMPEKQQDAIAPYVAQMGDQAKTVTAVAEYLVTHMPTFRGANPDSVAKLLYSIPREARIRMGISSLRPPYKLKK